MLWSDSTSQTNKAREWIQPLIGLATFAYIASGSTGWRFTIATIVAGSLAFIFVFSFLKENGFFSWVKQQTACWSANRTAKLEYKDFLKYVNKAERKLNELTNVLVNQIEWPTDFNNFARTTFENRYNELSHCARQLNVRRATDLELIGNRFRDFLDGVNLYYYQQFATVLRAGKAKYRYDDTSSHLRRAKDAYDKFLEQYNEFCEELNAKSGRQVLIGIHTGPSMMELPAVKSD